MVSGKITISGKETSAVSQCSGNTLSDFSLIGNRIPKSFFVTGGCGESDIAIHAGSYHLALREAGIEMCNIITYSSILPAIAHEVERPKLDHGCVMETIMAAGSGKRGERVAAGLMFGWLYDKRTGEKYGGLVCERSGDCDDRKIRVDLNASLKELYMNGFSEEYDLKDSRCVTQTVVPAKKYGTALVCLCFTTYVYPVILRSTSI